MKQRKKKKKLAKNEKTELCHLKYCYSTFGKRTREEEA